MTMIKAFRMDGLGNKFVIVDRRKDLVDISKEKIIHLGNLESFHRDIGFDQIIFIEKEVNNTFPIKIFNSDGNEIDACGNGARCVAYLLAKEKNLKEILLRTNNRLLEAVITSNLNVKLKMGKPLFNWNEIPLIKKMNNENITIDLEGKQKFKGFCLSVGNPHIIFFVKDYLSYNLKKLGPKIENYELFPEKINVTFAQIIDEGNISVNVWERGAGLTKACGTAACATGVAAYTKGLVKNNINIRFKKGVLNINYDKNKNIFMSGPVSDIKKITFKI